MWVGRLVVLLVNRAATIVVLAHLARIMRKKGGFWVIEIIMEMGLVGKLSTLACPLGVISVLFHHWISKILC